jgi:hypothetical protein
MDAPKPTKRRWFRFSLRTLFVLVTVLCVWLGWQVHLVKQRRAFLHWVDARGGWALLPTQQDSSMIPPWRRWLGDVAIDGIAFPSDVDQETYVYARRVFPESKTNVILANSTGLGRGRPGPRTPIWKP